MLGNMTHATLHALVDQVPASQVSEYATLFEAYRTHDRLLVQCLLAPEVEPELDEIAILDEVENKDVHEASSADDVRKRLGLL
jgi:hypothetical protein